MKRKFVFEKKELSFIKRLRIPENRDLKNGLRLNRNERVDNFEKSILEKIFKKVKNYDLGKYPDHQVIYESLSKFLKLKKENVLISSGSDGSIKSIFEIFLSKNDKVAVLSPTYAMYQVYSDIFKTKLIKIGYNKDYKLNRKQLTDIINRKNIKVLFIPNPTQPIEDIISKNEMTKLCKICNKKKILLVVDEAYYMFGAPTAAGLIKKFNNIIILRTFSKSLGIPSVRFGFILANKKIISIMNSYRLSYESNFLTDTVVKYFIDNFQIIKNYINKVKIGREYVRNECKKLGFNVIGKYSNFLLIDFRNNLLKRKLIKKLNNKKIYVKSNYTGILQNTILVTCGSKQIMKKFIKTLKV